MTKEKRVDELIYIPVSRSIYYREVIVITDGEEVITRYHRGSVPFGGDLTSLPREVAEFAERNWT